MCFFDEKLGQIALWPRQEEIRQPVSGSIPNQSLLYVLSYVNGVTVVVTAQTDVAFDSGFCFSECLRLQILKPSGGAQYFRDRGGISFTYRPDTNG